MKQLILPVPDTVSATYIVPVPASISTVEARRQVSKAVEERLTGPLRALATRWLAQGAVKVEVEPADTPPPGLLDKPLFGTPEQRVFLVLSAALFAHGPAAFEVHGPAGLGGDVVLAAAVRPGGCRGGRRC